MSDENMQKEIEKLRAENEELKSKKGRTSELSFKVSAKGAVSIYGMGRFPVTLYKAQWERLFERVDDIKGFIKENEGSLTVKN